jgi:hypothetical protein
MAMMNPHPVPAEPPPEDPNPANPTHLPVEPEFAPQLPPADPEDAHVKPPHP